MSEIEKLKTDEGPAESDLMKLLAKLSFFNYCDEKAFGTEWTDETGCFWDNPRDYLHGHTLGFCCCGDPESADEYLREVLAAINSEYDEQRWKGIERATGADEGQRYFVFYILDKLELAEHGGSVPGWLTEKGKVLLSDLEILKAIDELENAEDQKDAALTGERKEEK